MGYPYLDHEILPCVIGGKAHQTKKCVVHALKETKCNE